MTSKFKYISEEDLRGVLQSVQRLKKKRSDEQKWQNLISNSTERNEENADNENVPCTKPIHQHHPASSACNNASQRLCGESFKKCGRSSIEGNETKSEPSFCQESYIEEVCSSDATRINYWRSKILRTMDDIRQQLDNVPVPDGDEDLARRTSRATEFNAMFTRMHLYQLQRNYLLCVVRNLRRLAVAIVHELQTSVETYLKKHQNISVVSSNQHSSQINIMYKKLISSYQISLQALQNYSHHIPRTLMSALPGKLKNLLAYICHLEMALSNLNFHVDDSVGSSDVMMSKCESLLVFINAKRQEAENCTCVINHHPKGRHKQLKKIPFKFSPYNVKQSKQGTVSNKFKLSGMHKKSSGCLQIKTPPMKTRAFSETRNMRDKMCPDRSASHTSYAKKENAANQVVSKSEKSRTECCNKSLDVQSMGDNNISDKDFKLYKKLDVFDVVDKGTRIKRLAVKRIEKIRRFCQNDEISRKQKLCVHGEMLPPSCKCNSVIDAEEESHFCGANVSVKKILKSKKTSYNEILKKHEQCLLDEISSPSLMYSNTTDAKEEESDPATFSASVAQQKDSSGFVNGQKLKTSESSKEESHHPTGTQLKTYADKAVATDAEVYKSREKNVLQKGNMKIPWNLVEKLCDDFIQEAMKDVVKEAEDIICDIVKAMFENEFKFL